MEALVELIVKALVEQPDLVSVYCEEGERSSVIQVRAAPDDLGRVIGRNGRIASSIRTIVRAAGTKQGKSYWVNFDKIGGPEDEAPPSQEED